ncbi:type IV pilus biogenesis protein PilM [Burkholderia thailandensis]|uniref:PilM family protein n=1 Tax=Burkholderia thailandensis TaxID=57975 RepID=A0AAW9CU02_BURTH|nr:type IV pilus biogenesis protein PilM [Burkholderia thailandensis]MCS3392284.1 type IV pilus biogenesis protein PilM [Burkholderia thailandensis]MCS6427884.1 type IV pilus biogenesis protein PilM [Burkholderia thailandensis]MCS6453443.1 type IV pilus biogenesis protein PilM [Burkholderia thailandensis]MCS6467051.1 type IV pilus biogenesis protein PilM [Burkholderia thailandensis]MCS6485635.1 type IV pilus biogenesis protein PilM [Burkholderia thailandensis]
MYALAAALALASLAAVYATLHGPSVVPALQPARTAQALADNLAVYRQAALDYARAHPGTRGAVPNARLAFPAWYPGANPLWRNYVENGTVVAYAASMPPVNIAGEIATRADGSLLAGVAYRGAVVRPAYAYPGAPANGVPLPAGLSIANGLPVWMGQVY